MEFERLENSLDRLRTFLNPNVVEASRDNHVMKTSLNS